MTAKNDDRPTPRRRTPQPAPDANLDPMDMPGTARTPVAAPAAEKPAAAKKESAKPVAAKKQPARTAGPRRAVPASVPVTPKEAEDRAVVQLGIRVSVSVDQHLEEVRAATGRTRRELVESAIMALRVP